MPQPQISWTPADTYALEARTTRQWVIAQILDGHLNGVVSDSDWHVLNFDDEEGEGEDPDLFRSSRQTPVPSACH